MFERIPTDAGYDASYDVLPKASCITCFMAYCPTYCPDRENS